MSDTQQVKTCSRCSHPQTFFTKTWQKLEWANGKRFPTRHRGCGRSFGSSGSRIGARV